MFLTPKAEFFDHTSDGGTGATAREPDRRRRKNNNAFYFVPPLMVNCFSLMIRYGQVGDYTNGFFFVFELVRRMIYSLCIVLSLN